MNKQGLKLRCQNCEQLYLVEWDISKELPLTGYCCTVCYPEVPYYNGDEIQKIYGED